MLVERTKSDSLVVNPLPDGSRVIIDSESERVFAMNATAGAAWDACTVPTTLSGVTQSMQHSLHEEVSEELAEEAVQQLEKQRLVRTSGAPSQATRRKFIAMGAIAVPLVVSMSATEQRAYAQNANSGKSRDGDGGDHGGDGGDPGYNHGD